MRLIARRLQAALAIALGFGAFAASAHPYIVTLNTASLAGTQAQLGFRLIDSGAPGNSVSVSGFATDGALGAVTAPGAARDALATTLVVSDTALVRESLLSLVLGTTLSLRFESSEQAPDAGALPDGFVMVLRDAGGGSLVTTSDPTGANALLRYNIGSPLGLEVYASSGVGISVGHAAAGIEVPEPGSQWLTLLALGLLVGLRTGVR